ncbi:glutamate receptor ionotropic, kainate 2 [Drosophila willistoni]|uniref:glutamate receptor ionotropic, kainate 2 n=1 Tax=Drosophila willistoni TaxID=7260 RepID=UPI001F077BB1|nr:glutamate receptor ionotropic, kainate 2 [Drosophila willistoni]
MLIVQKELNTMNLDVRITDAVIILTRSVNQDADFDSCGYKDNCFQLAFYFCLNCSLLVCRILSNVGSSIVIDLTYTLWTDGYRLIQEKGIAYLRLERILRPFLEMFGDFMRQKRANNVAMIFSNQRDMAEAVQQMTEGFPFRTLLMDASQDKNFAERLQSLRPSPNYVAMFARGSAMNGLFEQVQKAGLFRRPTEWHFVFLDTRDRVFKYKRQAEFATRFTLNPRAICRAMQMRDLYCGSGFTLQRALLLDILRGLIGAVQISPSYPEPIYMDCNTSAEVNDRQDANAQDSAEWLEYVHWSNFITYATPLGYSFDDDSLKYEDGDNANTMQSLSFAINISAGYYSSEHEAKTDLARLSSVGEILLLNETISPARRFFRIGTAESIPWSYYRRNKQTGELILDRRGSPIWEGYCIDFIARLAEKLNFDYDIVEPQIGHMGQRNEQGEWDGVVGDLVSGQTDFAIAALKMYSEREEVVDFLPPYYEQTGISIVIRKPVRRTSLFKFMTVLRVEVWLSILAALVGTALMIWFMDKYSPYSSRNNREAYPYACREFTLRESFWFALTSFTPQGGGEAPKAVSGRMLVAAYWLFVVLMLATFTANLAAFLTVERMQTPVQSLEQLARQSRINYTVVHESDTHQYFINMKFAEDTLYRMWKELALNASKDFHKFRIWDYPIKEQYGHILLAINSSMPVRNAREGFTKVNNHENADYAFIHDSAEIKYEITRNCNLSEVGEVFAEQPYAVAVQQGSHLGDELSYAILELQKDRFFEQLKAKYWNQSNVQNCPLSEDQEGITLESLGGVFIATLFGLVLAMITLGGEIIYYKKRRKQLQTSLPITQVKPLDEPERDEQSNPRRAWHVPLPKSKPPAKITPPPSFEAATSKGKKLSKKITLGDAKFKPRHGLQSRRELGAPSGMGYIE